MTTKNSFQFSLIIVLSFPFFSFMVKHDLLVSLCLKFNQRILNDRTLNPQLNEGITCDQKEEKIKQDVAYIN